MCLSPCTVAPIRSQSVHNRQVGTAAADREPLALSHSPPRQGGRPLAGQGTCWQGLSMDLSVGGLKMLRFALWFPFSRAPGWWWITTRVLHRHLLLHGQIRGELCSRREERTGEVLLLWWQVALTVLFCLVLGGGTKLLYLKEWYKWKNLSGCFGTTSRRGKSHPNLYTLLWGPRKSLVLLWGASPRLRSVITASYAVPDTACLSCQIQGAPILCKVVTGLTRFFDGFHLLVHVMRLHEVTQIGVLFVRDQFGPLR